MERKCHNSRILLEIKVSIMCKYNQFRDNLAILSCKRKVIVIGNNKSTVRVYQSNPFLSASTNLKISYILWVIVNKIRIW